MCGKTHRTMNKKNVSSVDLKKQKIFDFQAIGNNEKGMYNKSISNSLNLMHMSWEKVYYDAMLENFWIPQKNDITQDKKDYADSSQQTKELYDNLLSTLAYLDSLQALSIVRVTEYISAPGINLLLIIQSFQEALHTETYNHLLYNVVETNRITDDFVDRWAKNEALSNRNRFILNSYESFFSNPTSENLMRYFIASYMLEAFSFYQGFAAIYSIQFHTGKFIGSADNFRLIHRDEELHFRITIKIINQLVRYETLKVDKQNRSALKKFIFLSEKEVSDIMQQIYENEKKFWQALIPNDQYSLSVVGMGREKFLSYLDFLLNRSKIAIGINVDKILDNPLAYLNNVGSIEHATNDVKSNFFESSVGKYKMSSSVDGWDF